MLEFLYQDGWGAFAVTLFFYLPFIVGFLWVIFRKSFTDRGPSGTPRAKMSRVEAVWLAVVIFFLIGFNVVSIGYMPTVVTARAEASQQDIRQIDVSAESWSYEISEREIEAGKPVRFSARSTDTMHGFAVYHPDGRMLFTMMLMPGLTEATQLVHTFDDPGTYKVRCLEYCGIAHHEMSDELIVVAKK